MRALVVIETVTAAGDAKVFEAAAAREDGHKIAGRHALFAFFQVLWLGWVTLAGLPLLVIACNAVGVHRL